MVIESDQLPLIKKNTGHFGNSTSCVFDQKYGIKNCSTRKYTVFIYSLLAGQKVFPDAEEILSILPQAFDEAFLSGKRRENSGR